MKVRLLELDNFRGIPRRVAFMSGQNFPPRSDEPEFLALRSFGAAAATVADALLNGLAATTPIYHRRSNMSGL